MITSAEVSAELGTRVYSRTETARRLGKSVRTIERWIDAGTLAHLVYDGRIYVTEKAIRQCESTIGYVQPPLPGLEPGEEFTQEQAAAVARVIDANRSRRARSRVQGGAA